MHILGELPNNQKLADTIVALLGLPRGNEDHSQGILHNLVADLNLKQQDEFFDPLSSTSQVWSGNKPVVLNDITEAHWRTEFDTRERLELLAMNLVSRYVLGDDDIEQLLMTRTANQLKYVKATLLKVLEQSVVNETQALLDGLAGKFIEPGPSGAPNRVPVVRRLGADWIHCRPGAISFQSTIAPFLQKPLGQSVNYRLRL